MSKKKIKNIECYACGTNERELISLGKNYLCGPCLRLDDKTYATIEINMDDHTLLVLAQTAMKENVTINAEITRAIRLTTSNPKQFEQIVKEAKELEKRASLLDGCGCACNKESNACCKTKRSSKKSKK